LVPTADNSVLRQHSRNGLRGSAARVVRMEFVGAKPDAPVSVTGEMEGKVNKALEFVGLSHKRDQNARTLSSGEAQRLGIARALVIEPEVLFLDEPTASVDQRNTQIIEDIILKMKKEHSSTVIITTHDRAQAERITDHLLTIKDGKIVNI